MKRLLFNFVCLLSLLLNIATIIFWLRSYRIADYVAYCLESKEFGTISTVGRILFYKESAIAPFRWKAPFGVQQAAHAAPDSIAAYAMPNASRQASWMGFGMISGDNGRYRASATFVPHWAVAVVTAILPVAWLRRRYWLRSNRGFELVEEPVNSGKTINHH